MTSFQSIIQDNQGPLITKETTAQVPTTPLIFHPFLANHDIAVNAEFRILICRPCQEAIPANEAVAHLQNKHVHLASTFKKNRFEQVAQELGLVSQLPNNMVGPRTPVHGLPVYNCLRCPHCSYISQHIKVLQIHYQSKHKELVPVIQWPSCKAQCWKRKGKGKLRAFWEVILTEQDTPAGSNEPLLAQLARELEEELLTVHVSKDRRLISPWLLTTGWHTFVESLNIPIEHACRLVALPPSHKREVEALSAAAEIYFQEAISLIDSTDELILKRLNSPDPTKNGISNTPFHKHMLDTTLRQYVMPIIRFITMSLACMWTSMNSDGTLENLQVMLRDKADEAQLVQQIHVVLLKAWMTIWKKEPNGNIIADPTEACLALLTLNQDGSFKEPKHVTTIIAKFEYCMRLTFLKEIRARAVHHGIHGEPAVCDELQSWFTENTYSTFARLRSLQHRATAIAYDTMGLPNIWWTDMETWQSMRYKGNAIAFSDVCKIFRDTEESLVTTWEKKVLRGLNLRVDYSDIVDDLSNKDVAYSFLSDPRNKPFQDRMYLIRAILEGKEAFSDFLLLRQGEMIWNRAALRSWLQDYAELERLILLRAEMLSGAPSRGSELSCMSYRNTQARTTRNLMIFGQHVTLLCQYSKTSSLTGHDKLIPHSLDAVTGDILIQDLAIARPFAQIAARICFEDQAIVQLYKDQLFMNFGKAFTSQDLSSVMATFSLPHIQFSLTINPWRHIQTAWKRKFKCAIEDVVEFDREEDVDALQAGHTRATENRIYGLSTQSLAGAAEDILPLFLQASIAWQERCQVAPGGLGLPYTHARSGRYQKHPTIKKPWSMHDPPARSTTEFTPAVIEQVAEQVVERLTPMLDNIMQAITALKSSSTSGKGKQKETVVAESSPSEGESTDPEIEAEVQRAILASLAANNIKKESSGSGATRRRVVPIPVPAAETTLNKMQVILFDQNATWRSEQQRTAMKAVLQRETDIVAILPTGGGKSMLGIIPSLIEHDMITILVLPLNSLIMDYEQRLKTMAVPYQIYESHKDLSTSHNLVLVSADKSLTTHWRSMLADLGRRKTIARIVIDEAHIPLISKSYRKTLSFFYDIRSEPVPLVLLSATLPPALARPLATTYQLLSTTLTIRQDTNRPELKYVLEK
ncbi:hypothetical protein EV363DRAFT_1178010, partial [Boletus edulis]